MTSCKVIKSLLPVCALVVASGTHASIQDTGVAQKTEVAQAVSYQLNLGLNSVSNSDKNEFEHVINYPNANFIKVNFAKFSLPKGAYLEVSDLKGKEVYRYDQSDSGVFSSMSVSADAIKLKLVVSEPSLWEQGHGIEVADFFAGYSDTELASNEIMSGLDLIEPNSTCGINERRDVACWETSHPVEYERSRPVARLLIGGRSLCTAWRVGAGNHMFTNNHCFDSAADAKNVEVWFNYQRSVCGSGSTNGTVKVMADQLLATDYRLDYTLFTVSNFEKIRQFGHFGLDVSAQQKGQRIFIPQHGSGNPKELAIESDQNAGGYCQIDQTVTAGRGSDTDMGYKCDTIGGSSGSPVVSAHDNNVIALHHYGNSTQCTTKLNRGTRIELIWPEVATHFGGVIPKGDTDPVDNTPPVANFSFTKSALSVAFTDTSFDDKGVVSYDWQFGDGTTSQLKNPTHSYGAAGTYSVSLTVKDAEGLQSTKTQQVTVSVGGGCAVDAWLSSKVYLQGDQVSQNGSIYEAQWWNKGDSPADHSSKWEVWQWVRDCN
ncbi:PKD domain-containing protein [Pseudoalteromonas luteoviolacea]|uniref:PKD domain-containing protein n=1 Tax=Pseudoalteromonas luteoviolacea S4054 TaxID=1129367 RepID=A0A0F6A5C6_9GAMM|nr:PKD domain-containing protein [Pseudoalteromonas luteoviolacea]AOT07642.1 hypothetical protein S4054249_07210 [Pseudoalteromonas luteoviolacea]AOT12558.1 hypothetical protein S40542_07210 [Pseudoalteromonas luteoviolacea]AOT17472.1 hypothetical protein S4054_07210 [Pseudoalteromonas luteoviolacea]KKE81385.1 hypothetical protein N479_22895 [Pseudoalteromonas luteoviolacea S4054]KZN70606.1 hypothetical protein N481_20535 [Pseudoalteromonas luteoviolacea S4047-1]